MLTFAALAIFAVIAVSLLIVWFFPPATPRRYVGKLKRYG